MYCSTLFFLYFVGFLLNLVVPKSIDSGVASNLPTAIVINISLVTLFGTAHSIMARDRFKRWWTQFIPPAAERSTYVLQASLLMGLLMWQWRPLPTTIWQIEGDFGRITTIALCFLGVALVLASSFQIDHFELFGLQQVYRQQRNEPMPEVTFTSKGLYRIVRHPLQLGLLIMLLATPHMTVGHLLLAVTMTVYILIGLHFEEKALVRQFGDAYRQYQQTTPQLVPGFGRKARTPVAHSGD